MSTLQFASFYLDDALYGIGILQIREVIKQIASSPVPQAPDVVDGLMNLRGQIVTLIDLSRSLGLTDAGGERETCIILKTDQELLNMALPSAQFDQVGSDAVGLLVDRMGEVVDVDEGDIAPAPANASQVDAGFLRGVVQLDDELMSILSLSRVLDF